MIHIPTNELRITFARSSGAGGQNVNKTSTKAVVHWPIGRSRILSVIDKLRLRTKLANRINSNDELFILAETERSQTQNIAEAIKRMQKLATAALHVPPRRRPTRPTKGSKLKRLESKKIRSKLKVARRTVD